MNVIREITRLNERELSLNVSTSGSWHASYQSSTVFVGGLNFGLSEGDLICVFSQFGEVIDCVLIRNDIDGKSRGFGFITYEDRRSAVLAIDNLNGVTLCGRIIRVDHAEKYRRPRTEQERNALKNGNEAEFAKWNEEADQQDLERRKLIWDADKWKPVLNQSNNQSTNQTINQPSGNSIISRLSSSPSLATPQSINQSTNQSIDSDAQRLQAMLDKQRERRERMEKEEKMKNEPKRRHGR